MFLQIFPSESKRCRVSKWTLLVRQPAGHSCSQRSRKQSLQMDHVNMANGEKGQKATF